MCPRQKLTRPQGVMDRDIFRKIVDNAVECGVKHVFLGGFGEPMIDPDFIERIRYIKSKGLTVSTITNASLLNTEMASDIIESGLDSIRISFYGLTRDVYESVHRGLSFDTALSNIRTLLKLRKEKNKSNPEISVSFLVLDKNNHQAAGFREFWKDADFAEIWQPHNYIDGCAYRGQTVNLRSCGRPSRGPLQVQWDGIVVPCCFDYNGYVSLGDLRKQGIEGIMHSQLYEKLRQAHLKMEFKEFYHCSVCDQLNFEYNPLVFSSDPRRAPGRSNSNFFDLIKREEQGGV